MPVRIRCADRTRIRIGARKLFRLFIVIRHATSHTHIHERRYWPAATPERPIAGRRAHGKAASSLFGIIDGHHHSAPWYVRHSVRLRRPLATSGAITIRAELAGERLSASRAAQLNY
jgi:hypothetical protein